MYATVFDTLGRYKGRTKPAPFDIKLDKPVDFSRIYVRDDVECLLVLWNKEPLEEKVRLTLPVQKYLYPVKISLFNYREITDIPYQLEGEKILIFPELKIGQIPVIIRLVAEKNL